MKGLSVNGFAPPAGLSGRHNCLLFGVQEDLEIVAALYGPKDPRGARQDQAWRNREMAQEKRAGRYRIWIRGLNVATVRWYRRRTARHDGPNLPEGSITGHFNVGDTFLWNTKP